ncbi:hypothetical protein DERP_001099 [Dermatophagoides pteronyssinus]|uniref:Uncharacterized protein n=1 Tax=Dermatophagoides pteronyssinus TaxID=6956 RepID=A0ABQ8JDI9_DERPT|nr:hypothetical protein DERP_001099 [Dermatophagoides pteronyssinus]
MSGFNRNKINAVNNRPTMLNNNDIKINLRYRCEIGIDDCSPSLQHFGRLYCLIRNKNNNITGPII